jgi:hypothetical protein
VKFKFIDFFAGIGGFRQALQNLGGECVFSCEIDKQCEMTYQENYGETFSHDNISTLHENDVPYAEFTLNFLKCKEVYPIHLISRNFFLIYLLQNIKNITTPVFTAS